MEHVLAQVVLDGRVHVVLAVDADQLVALGVVHDEFVVAAAALGAVGLDAADHPARGRP